MYLRNKEFLPPGTKHSHRACTHTYCINLSQIQLTNFPNASINETFASSACTLPSLRRALTGNRWAIPPGRAPGLLELPPCCAHRDLVDAAESRRQAGSPSVTARGNTKSAAAAAAAAEGRGAPRLQAASLVSQTLLRRVCLCVLYASMLTIAARARGGEQSILPRCAFSLSGAQGEGLVYEISHRFPSSASYRVFPLFLLPPHGSTAGFSGNTTAASIVNHACVIFFFFFLIVCARAVVLRVRTMVK